MSTQTLYIPSEYIRKCKAFGFNKEYINALLNDKLLFDYFFQLVEEWFEPKNVAKWLAWPLMKSGISWENFIQKYNQYFVSFLIKEREKKLMDNQLKIVFDEMLATGETPDVIIQRLGFDAPAMETSALEEIIQEVLSENSAQVQQFKDWKETLMWFFVGQVMRKSLWKANPQVVDAIIRKFILTLKR